MAEKTFSPVRVRAATQEAAIAQALQMTGASREEIEIEVLEETEKGVTIRIAPIGTAAAKAEAAPIETTPVGAVAPAESTLVAEEEDEDASEEVEEETDADDEEDVEEDVVSETLVEESVPLTAQGDADDAVDEAASEEIDEEVEAKQAPVVREADPEVVEHARVLAQEMLDHMGLEAQAIVGDLPAWCLPTSHDKSERVRDVPRAFLNIEGEDVGILIGKHGQTLQSFQYLLNLSLNNTTEDEEASAEGVRAGGVHVVVDAGEYRGRRAVALDRAAREAAERARRDRRSVRMEPMPGHERRLVHLALFDDKSVVTSSEGRDPWRRVVVTPAGVRPSAPREERGGRGGNERYNERSGGNRGPGRGGYGGNRESSGGGNRSGGSAGGGNRSYGSGAGNAGGGRRSYN